MKRLRLFFSILIAILSFNTAYADYQLIYTAKDKSKYYIDLTTRSFEGNTVTVMEYTNYGKRTDLGEMSVRALVEYECSKKMWRTLHLMSYSEHNFEGVLVAELKKYDAVWRKIVDGQISMFLFNQVCKLES